MSRLESDWPEVRFRYLAEVQKGTLPPSTMSSSQDYGLLPYLTMNYLRGEDSEPSLVPAGLSALLASENSTLLLWDGSNAGEFLSAKRGVVSSTSALVTPRGVDERFFYYACKSKEDQIKAESVGMGIPHVDGDSLANIAIRLPPPPQQRSIADYLDRKTARLDALVAAKERVLKLLAEKRQAVIARAVTRGIDPDATPTGGGGMTPQAVVTPFPTKRLKYVVSLAAVTSRSNRERKPFIGLEDIVSWTGGLSPAFSVNGGAEDDSLGNIFEPGDVLFGKLRPYLAKVWVAEFPGRSTGECLVMTPVGIEPRFLGYVCLDRSFIDAVDAATFGSKMPRAEWGFIGDMQIPMPGRREQRTIADYLDRETARLDALTVKIEDTVTLLRERRAALVAGTVTGLINVECAA